VLLATVVVAALGCGAIVIAASPPAADPGRVVPGAFRPAEETPEPRRVTNCDDSWDDGTADEVPDELRYVPTVVPAGRVTRTSVLVQRDHQGCHLGSEALILAELDPDDANRVLRTVSLRGPSYGTPAALPGSQGKRVAIRGGHGTWIGGWLSWTESDGGTWDLTGNAGQAEMLRIAEQLSIDLAGSGPPAQLAEVPAPFTVLWQRLEPEDRGFNEDWTWYVRLEPSGDHSPEPDLVTAPPTNPPLPVAPRPAPPVVGTSAPPGVAPLTPAPPQPVPLEPRPTGAARMQLSITRMSTPVSVMGRIGPRSTLTSVGGRPAMLSISEEGERQTTLSWDEAPGVEASLTVWDHPADLELLQSIAESLELAPPDDHRFAD
jgi:hypothetical protein